MELDLCGHATIASAHVLWEQKIVEGEEIFFETKTQGTLKSKKLPENWIQLDFPAIIPTQLTDADLISQITTSLGEGVKVLWIGESPDYYILEVEEESVYIASPDFALIKKFNKKGVVISAQASKGHGHNVDFVTRFFAPALGIDEDSVSGSPHTVLGPYWKNRLGKTEISSYQASNRGGIVRVFVTETGVSLAGQAVTTIRSEMLL